MSKFTRVNVKFTNIDALKVAIEALGYDYEYNAAGIALYGYQGDRRDVTADLVVRRDRFGRSSNDLGFRQNPDGTIDVIISEYDRDRLQGDFVNELKRAYAVTMVELHAKQNGFTIAGHL